MAKIIIEGWRFLPHSFATVNQFQALELLKRPHLRLYHRDAPYWNNKWKPASGLLQPEKEQALRDMPAPPENDDADVTLRAGCPFNFSASRATRTITFATCEFGRLSDEVLADPNSVKTPLDSSIRIITPSRWSREGLVRSGLNPDIITTVPHGIDPDIFHPPTDSERMALRKQFGWEGCFIFLHISAMTPNKGIPDILKSLYEIGGNEPAARLVLKGLDSLYTSTAALGECLKRLPPQIHPAIKSRVAYTSGDNSYDEIARLYKAADAYVAPYLGEGFNLPVLEAAACGLPIICTGGGATDDFTTSDFRLAIRSQQQISGDPDSPAMIYLRPDQSHLTSLMRQIIEDRSWRLSARRVGPEYVRERFTWKHVADKLEDVFFS